MTHRARARPGRIVLATVLVVLPIACGDAGISGPGTTHRPATSATGESAAPVDPATGPTDPGEPGAGTSSTVTSSTAPRPSSGPTTSTPAQGEGATGGAPPGTVFEEWDALHLSAYIDLDSEEAFLSPAAAIPSAAVEFSDGGDHTLDLFGEAGELIASVGFDADSVSYEETPTAFFDIVVPLPDVGMAGARVSLDGRELWSIETGAAVPSVTITKPAGGDAFAGATVPIEWAGTDPDDDDLTYTVFYSADDTGSWQPLATELPEMTISAKRRNLAGSTKARILVIATDGLNSSHAISDTFSVGTNPPTVDVEGAPVYELRGAQLVLLRVRAHDREDGFIESTVVWSSDIDGRIGRGEGLAIQAAELSEGTHAITATATDSDGQTGSDTVEVDIGR